MYINKSTYKHAIFVPSVKLYSGYTLAKTNGELTFQFIQGRKFFWIVCYLALQILLIHSFHALFLFLYFVFVCLWNLCNIYMELLGETNLNRHYLAFRIHICIYIKNPLRQSEPAHIINHIYIIYKKFSESIYY